MKQMMKMVLAVVMAAVWGHVALSAVRVDTRSTAGFYIATGTERVGDPYGSSVTEWDTIWEGSKSIGRPATGLRPDFYSADRWTSVSLYADESGAHVVNVLVLNGLTGRGRSVLSKHLSVEGGRLSQNTTWGDTSTLFGGSEGRLRIVRDDVIVPNGITLTLGAGCIVKFTEGARIVVEDGGAVVAEGAYLAAFDDDSVGGDTDMNGRRDEDIAPYRGWLDDLAVAALATVKFVDGATNLPTRTYTAGKVYGTLPELVRDDAMFGGWFAESGGLGQAALPDDVVASGETVLHAHWIPYELGIDPESADVGCLASEGTIAVTANSAWEVSCDADWVTVQRVGDDQVAYSVAENATADARVATIRIVAEHGLVRDFTLTQGGMAQLAAPTINPADGTMFSGSARRVSISGAEAGAEIRYTLDGSEPTAASKLYTKSFNVFDTTVVKARAFMAGKRASETVSSRIVRLLTLAEALDVPLWTVTTDGDAVWTVDETAGRNGSSCARSGAIGDDQESTLTTTIEGAGTLTFWWKVDCEDDPDYDNWDFLAFEVDGAEVARVDGNSGWRQVTVKIKSEGTHTLTWTYSKDYMDDDLAGIEDCGWVDQVSWTPLVGDSEVPVAWLENLGMLADGVSAMDAANADPDGDGLTTAQEYVAGTDPNDFDSKLTAYIEMVDGDPVVTYAPDLLNERAYKKLGKKKLDDPTEPWVEVKDGEEGNYNFFKVTVELP